MDTDSPTDDPPYVRVWEYEVAPEREESFRRIYGPAGDWAKLFRQALGYLGTELTQTEAGSYRTTDRWEAEAAWIVFRQKHAAAYEALDRACEDLTISERMVYEGDG